jgi:hypothetical protein
MVKTANNKHAIIASSEALGTRIARFVVQPDQPRSQVLLCALLTILVPRPMPTPNSLDHTENRRALDVIVKQQILRCIVAYNRFITAITHETFFQILGHKWKY